MSPDLTRLGALQTEWATQQWLLGIQAWSTLCCGWFDAQSALWRDAERGLRGSLPPWLADVRPLPLQPLFEAPDSLAPAVLMQRASAVWLALGQACANTLDHDLDQTDQADHAGPRGARAGARRTRAHRAAVPRGSKGR